MERCTAYNELMVRAQKVEKIALLFRNCLFDDRAATESTDIVPRFVGWSEDSEE
jgi:hypothetical protein